MVAKGVRGRMGRQGEGKKRQRSYLNCQGGASEEFERDH